MTTNDFIAKYAPDTDDPRSSVQRFRDGWKQLRGNKRIRKPGFPPNNKLRAAANPVSYQQRRAAGLCGDCGAASPDYARCAVCREARADVRRRRRVRQPPEVVRAVRSAASRKRWERVKAEVQVEV